MQSSEVKETLLKSKVATFTAPESFTKAVDWFRILQQACEHHQIRLLIPETLMRRDNHTVFLHTSDEGYLCCNTSHSAVEEFTYSSAGKLRNLKTVNPQAAVFPQYIAFGQKGVLYTIAKETQLRNILDESHLLVQRFIVPKNYSVSKYLVRWRRNADMKIYNIISNQTIKPKRAPIISSSGRRLSLDSQYIASLKDLKHCHVVREKAQIVELQHIVNVALGVLQEFGLESGELAEEFCVEVMVGCDGRFYFLTGTGVDVSLKASLFRSQTMNHRGSVPSLIPLSSHSSDDDSPRSAQNPARRRATLELPQSFSFGDSPVDQVAAEMDRFGQMAQARKEEEAFRQALGFKDRPSGFFEHCIANLEEKIAKEPKLAKYLPKDAETISRLKAEFCRLFQHHQSVYIIKNAFQSLSVTEADYRCFLRIFSTTLSEQGVAQQHVDAAVSVVERFKDVVVSKRRIVLTEEGLREEH